ncbi:MAG: CBS domain-containing protein, partial [Nitrospinaceae bacterium]|nr:CBS domain-containing protein [Nitrospinaceae bacterium]NIR56760.1 CBS domain-containing protein [Nitrospinaceae bacterium]NIS87211.1 CBS domain-containing protein [Nitrospinaceae bacterium]NIT84081.1 CBS domain-containing protein [Nitrospinaceae bacterium]NIU46260.1 CBS domain-containing protein [Nitrospinaceae bacterium]
VMSKSLITIKKSDTLKKAQDLMVAKAIRHLPVVDGKELLGIITESDIRGAFIGKGAKTASGKIQALHPSKMKVSDYMTRDPMVVTPETHIEDAALIIYKYKIGALPVIKRNNLVGIVSIMDILGLFVDLMGIIHSSSRVDVVMDKNPKNFEKVSKIINNENLNIISVGMAPYGTSGKKQVYFFRLDLCDTQSVVKKIEAAGFKVVSAID